MGYSKHDAELDIMRVDRLRAETAGMLARHEIGGFDKLAADAACDEAERKINGKLTGIRLAILDREGMEKNGRFAWVKKTKTGLIVKVGQGSWKPTTEAEIAALEKQGVTVIRVTGYRDPNAGPAPAAPVAEVYDEPQRKRVTREEAHRLAAEGCMIIWPEQATAEYAEVVEYA